MAFQSRNLSVLAYANGFTHWHFITEDSADAILDSGYFNDGADMLRVGDLLEVNAKRDGRADFLSIHVSEVANGTVTVEPVRAIAAA